MDPFSIIFTCIALMLIVIVLTPVVKIFAVAIRSMWKSMKKTAQIIRS